MKSLRRANVDTEYGITQTVECSVMSELSYTNNMQSYYNCIYLQNCFIGISGHSSEQMQLVQTTVTVFILRREEKSL